MAKKDYFLLADTETSQDQKVADFAAIIVDRKGIIHNQIAVLVAGIFDNPAEHPLFYSPDDNEPASIWSLQGQTRRYKAYYDMLDKGERMLASVGAINHWLEKANGKYNPILTAYNLPFDMDKAEKTDINLKQFINRFCLWSASYNKWAHRKEYLQFVLDNIYFNPPTKLGNWSFKTNAEVMARFVTGVMLEDEPHTALEDILYYELPILVKLVNSTKKHKWMKPDFAFDWKRVQVKENFVPRPTRNTRERRAMKDLFEV